MIDRSCELDKKEVQMKVGGHEVFGEEIEFLI
jgi:hypothetical protein